MEQSINGEIHLVFPEPKSEETGENPNDINEAEIRKIMKKEASKPLLLFREEWMCLTGQYFNDYVDGGLFASQLFAANWNFKKQKYLEKEPFLSEEKAWAGACLAFWSQSPQFDPVQKL